MLRSTHLLLVGMLLFALAACKKANIEVPSIQSTTINQPVLTDTPRQWWTVFRDDTLNSLVERALAANLDIARAQSRLKQIQLERHINRASRMPEIGGSATVDQASDSAADFSINAGVRLSWELDFWGRRQHLIRADDHGAQAADLDMVWTAFLTSTTVAEQYLSAITLRQKLALQDQQIARVNRQVSLIEQRVINGLAQTVDLIQQKNLRNGLLISRQALSADLEETLNHLTFLCGQQPGLLEIDLPGQLPAMPDDPKIEMADLIHRPDIASAFATLSQHQQMALVREAERYPSISIGVGADYTRESPDRGIGWVIAQFIRLDAPLFDGGRRRAVAAAQRERAMEQWFTYKQTYLRGLQDLDSAHERLKALKRQWQLAQDNLRLNQQSLELAEKRYLNGNLAYLNLLAIQNDLLDAETHFIDTRLALFQGLVTVFKALGV